MVLVVTFPVAVGSLACQSPTPDVARPPAAASDPMERAWEAMGRRDYDVAVGLLREALARRPADLEAHYRLGVSASHLDRVDEAAREFEWVVAHGEPGTPEVQVARDWLASRAGPSVSAPSVSPAAEEGPAQKPELASLSGRALGPEGPKARLQLFLKGTPGSPVKNEYHLLRTDQQGNFHFPNVVPGHYMLTNAIAGAATWRLRIPLTPGQHVVDLSPANSSAVRDDFPERAR